MLDAKLRVWASAAASGANRARDFATASSAWGIARSARPRPVLSSRRWSQLRARSRSIDGGIIITPEMSGDPMA